MTSLIDFEVEMPCKQNASEEAFQTRFNWKVKGKKLAGRREYAEITPLRVLTARDFTLEAIW